MNVLHIIAASVLLLVVGCAGVPRTHSSAPGAAVVNQESTCPALIDPNAIMKYGYPEKYMSEYREPPRVYPLYTCGYMQPLIRWAKSASNYESDYGGCTGDSTSFTCRSERGPSGTSRRGSDVRAEGQTFLDVKIAEQILKPCPKAASERRELRVSVWQSGSHGQRHEWKFEARSECYY